MVEVGKKTNGKSRVKCIGNKRNDHYEDICESIFNGKLRFMAETGKFFKDNFMCVDGGLRN